MKINPKLAAKLIGSKASKYRNKHVVVVGCDLVPADYAKSNGIVGILFDSIREAKRWLELLQLEKDGKIEKLQRQVPYNLDVNGVHICRYVADFQYTLVNDYRLPFLVEDAKGHRTREYQLKKKLMKAVWGIDIVEV